MKFKNILFFILIVSISNTSFSQSKKIVKKAKVHFLTGEIKIGKMKIPYGKISSFKFMEESTNERMKLDARDIDKIDIGGTIYRFVKIKGTSRPILLLEQIPQEKLGLYYYEFDRMRNGSNDYSSTTKKRYYYIRDTEKEATQKKNWNSKNKLIEYLSDCPELVEKIGAGFFDKKGKSFITGRPLNNRSFTADVVRYYNKHCK